MCASNLLSENGLNPISDATSYYTSVCMAPDFPGISSRLINKKIQNFVFQFLFLILNVTIAASDNYEVRRHSSTAYTSLMKVKVCPCVNVMSNVQDTNCLLSYTILGIDNSVN